MNVGEPVVGWVDPVPLKKAARREARAAVMAFSAAILLVYELKHDDSLFVRDLHVVGFAVAGLGGLVAGLLGWLAFVYSRAAKDGWGALHARLDGDHVVLGPPFSLFVGKGKRLARGEIVRLSVANRTLKGRAVSEWTIAGARETAVMNPPGAWTEAMWYDLGRGL